ncbi:MAG: hypothetical protein GF364_10780 [Candidatus Lokiarchaeota archaeon]|nr:hypothetical protein [Candidatus Lokiarchaeota archaeon]
MKFKINEHMDRLKVAVILILMVVLAGISYILSQYYEFWCLNEVEGEEILVSKGYDGDRGYNAFPKVVRIHSTDSEYHNDELLAVWYNGDSHVDSNSDGVILGSYSQNNGSSWGTPFLIYDDPSLDCRNIGLICAQNGSLIVFFAKVDVSKIENKVEAWTDFGYIISYNGGESWTTFRSIINQEQFESMSIITGNGYGDPVCIENEIYVLCYGYPQTTLDETHVAFLLTSNDNGETWILKSNLSLSMGISTSEADFWYNSTQDLLFGFSRTQNTDPRYLYYFDSTDRGTSWLHLKQLNIQGDCPDIFQLLDGRYLVVIRAYGKQNVYVGYFTLPSNFAGISFEDKENILENIEIKCLKRTTFRSSHGNVAYPSIASIDGEKILVVYYDIGAGGVFGKIVSENAL